MVETRVENPIQLLDEQKTSPELMRWAQEGWRRGRLKFEHFKTPSRLTAMYRKFRVAIHEFGHVHVARSRGWRVLEFCIEPRGNVLGFVRVAPPNKPIHELIEDSAAISFGGNVAQQSEEGCGSDFAHINNMGDIAQNYLGRDKLAFINNQKSRAASAVPGISSLENEAWGLDLAA